jgi:toxin ParE1/3/4
VRLKWERESLLNLVAIHDYICQHDPRAAESVAQRIQATAFNLKSFPLLGRPAEIGDVRLLQVPGLPYLLPYHVKGDVIHILAVFDERRKRPPEWQ